MWGRSRSQLSPNHDLCYYIDDSLGIWNLGHLNFYPLPGVTLLSNPPPLLPLPFPLFLLTIILFSVYEGALRGTPQEA